MSHYVRCHTIRGIYNAFRKGDIPEVYDSFTFDLRESEVVVVRAGCPTIRVYGSGGPQIYSRFGSSPFIQVFESSRPGVTTFDTSKTTIEAYDSSSLYIMSGDQSSVTVTLYDSSKVQNTLRGNAIITKIQGVRKEETLRLSALDVLLGEGL